MCPSSNDKFCIECVYAAPWVLNETWDGKTYQCHNEVHGRNVVTKEWIKPNCLFARSLAGKCGPAAIHFQPIGYRNETQGQVTLPSKESISVRSPEIRQDGVVGNISGTFQDH